MKNNKLHRFQTHLTDTRAKSNIQQIGWLEHMQKKLSLEGQGQPVLGYWHFMTQSQT